jgi:hypothetical protein
VADGPKKKKKLLGYPWNFYKATKVYSIYIYLGVKIHISIIGRVVTWHATHAGGFVFESWMHLIFLIIKNQFLSDKILSQTIKDTFP